jgi:hypothetical protein
VLAELPSMRPQRASARRETARARRNRARSTEAEPKEPVTPKAPAGGPKKAPAKAKPKPRASNSQAKAPRTAPQRAHRVGKRAPSPPPSTPRQGYEADHDLTGTLTPPSGTEVVGSLAELAGELVQSSISAGGRLIKGALSRLSGS